MPSAQGGFPSQITFADGKVFDSLRWNDRLYHRRSGSFSPTADRQAKVSLVSQGPLCTAVRVTGRYVQANGKAPPSAPQAVYDWLYLADRPLVLVRAAMQQQEPFVWPEVHFLELDYPREAFPRWAGGEPLEQGAFTASKKSFSMPQWGAVLDGPRAIAMMQCGKATALRRGPRHLSASARGCGLEGLERDPPAVLGMAVDRQPPRSRSRPSARPPPIYRPPPR